MPTTTSNNDKDNDKKKKRRSMFSEAEAVEQKLKAAKRKADFDRQNSLSVENAQDVAHTLLVKALREEFEKVDKLQGGSFIHGSMQRLNTSMWKGLTDSSRRKK